MFNRSDVHAAALVCAAIMFAAPAGASAQDEMGMHDSYESHGCTFCSPWVYVQGGALVRPTTGTDSGYGSDFMLRALVEVGTPSPHVGLFTHVQIVPSDDPLPSLRYGAQLWLLPRFSDFNITGGLGLVHDTDVVRGWGHVGLEWQTPLHEIALYAQAGLRFAGEDPEEFQLGIRHPIAPWKAHLLP